MTSIKRNLEMSKSAGAIISKNGEVGSRKYYGIGGGETVTPKSRRRETQLPSRYFDDCEVGYVPPKKRTKSELEMGMLPPKYSKGLEDLNKNESSGKMHQPPSEPISYRKKSDGKKKELEEDSSMFQISALRQSGGISFEAAQGQESSLSNVPAEVMKPPKLTMRPTMPTYPTKHFVASANPSGINPCSYLCPDVQGEVPTVQCIRCLCFFHTKCLGLSTNHVPTLNICHSCQKMNQRLASSRRISFPLSTPPVGKPARLSVAAFTGIPGLRLGSDVTVTRTRPPTEYEYTRNSDENGELNLLSSKNKLVAFVRNSQIS